MTAIALQVEYVIGGQADGTVTRLTTALERAGAELANLGKHVLPRVAKALEAGTAAQFAAEGAGPQAGSWAALSTSYAAWKQRVYPGQPKLVATGAMRAALTDGKAPGAKREIGNDSLSFGTTGIPYASYHQTGTGRMPSRPPFDFGSDFEKAMNAAAMAGVREAVREGSEALLDFDGATYTEDGTTYDVQTGANGGRFVEMGGGRVYLKRTAAGRTVKRRYGGKS